MHERTMPGLHVSGAVASAAGCTITRSRDRVYPMHRRVGLLRSPHSDTRLRDDDRTSLHDVEPIGTVARGKHRVAIPKPADRMRPKLCSTALAQLWPWCTVA